MKTTRREKVWIAICMVAAAILYPTVRHRIAKKNLEPPKKTENKSHASAQKQQESLKKQERELKTALENLEANINKEQADLDSRQDKDFVEGNYIQKIRSRISELAMQNDVWIIENVRHEPDGSQHDQLIEDLLRGSQRRPVQKFVLDCSYVGFSRFLKALEAMPNRVTVLEFDIQVVPNLDAKRERLKATLIIAW